MELFDVMRTTFSCRQFTDDDVPDAALYEMFENARFAPSGGNRQGNFVIVVRDPRARVCFESACGGPRWRRSASRPSRRISGASTRRLRVMKTGSNGLA